MPPRKIPNAVGDSWILLWSDAMINVFLELLEEAHDNGKRSDTGFKPEAWVQFRTGVQNVYLGDEHITVAKLRSKLDYWKQRWQGWKWVGAHSGVGWNEELELWTTSDDVWEIIFVKKPKLRWVQHNTLEYRLFFYKIFENRAANGEHAQSIQSLNRANVPTTVIDPTLFTLEDCGLFDMTSESEGTCTRREDREKRKVELEELNQQDNEEHQIRQSRRVIQPKFKASFTKEMSKSIGINSQPGSHTTSRKRGSEYLDEEIVDTFQTKKKGKKLSGGEQIALEMHNWTVQNATTQEQRRIEKLTEEIRAIKDIKVHYAEAIAELSLEEFGAFVLGMQKRGDKYGDYTAGQYYLLLTRGPLRDKFMEIFLETIQEKED